MDNYIESNKLIAEFMGDFKLVKEFKPDPDIDVTYCWKKLNNKSFGYDTTDWTNYSTNEVYSDRVCYNYSWDWLMPVVEKIWSITEHRGLFYLNVIEINSYGNNEDITLYSEDAESTILEVYNLVIKFIEWYNKNK